MDIILYNGIIHTLDQKNSIKEAIGIKEDRIVFLGNNTEVETMEAEVKIDLQGQLVLPGFIDTHLHILDYAFTESCLKLNDCTSIKEIIEKGKRFLESNVTKNGWILGKGWDQGKFANEERFLLRTDLDHISTEHPLLYSRVCGHVATVNSLALGKILALKEAKELMEFIDIEQGILRESAVFLYTKLVDSLSMEEIAELIILAHKNLNKEGITGVHTVDFLTLPGNDWEKIIMAYKLLESQEKLTVRTYEQCMFNDIKEFNNFLEKGYTTGQGSEFFKIGPLKLLADGSLGARTALMKEPYSDDTTTCGVQVFDEEELRLFFIKAFSNDMQIAVHGIGDKSIEISVDLLNELNDKNQGNPMRHGIIHAQITNTEILNKMYKGDLIAYIQPVFVGTDMDIVESRIGKERMNKIYAWKTMRDKGIKTSGGSDAPVESFSILENIYFSVTRKNIKGSPEDGWLPDEKLSVEEAVRLFTCDAAYPSFEENVKGTLEIGKFADMVVLDKNIYDIPPEDIKNVSVTYTIMNGKIVYNS